MYVGRARFVPASGQTWQSSNGWVREFTKGTDLKTFVTFPARDLKLEPPDYFATEAEEPDRMTYAQLTRYISDLSASGVNVVPQTVALYRKVSFPFVTLIMTLIAVPFAVTHGHGGALYGIAVALSWRGVLDDKQRLQCGRYSRDEPDHARRLGAKPHLRSRRRRMLLTRAYRSAQFFTRLRHSSFVSSPHPLPELRRPHLARRTRGSVTVSITIRISVELRRGRTGPGSRQGSQFTQRNAASLATAPPPRNDRAIARTLPTDEWTRYPHRRGARR